MNSEELWEWYVALPDHSKQIFLSLVSQQLTIHCRAFSLDLEGIEQVRAFKGINELQHQLSAQAAAIGLGHDRYPDEVLLRILIEKAAAYGLLAHLKQSFDYARHRNVWESK
jgi:hypothetical protein